LRRATRPRRAVVTAVAAALLLAGCGGSGDTGPKASPTRSADGVAVVAEQQAGPRLLDLTVRSPALDATAQVRLLTPTGWEPKPERRWRVLYLLHGCCDTYESWTRSTDVETWPELKRTLVVMPEGGDVGFYSNWKDGPGWETFHLTELRTLLERDYGAGEPRAIAGLSMGGLGAMAYAARHPGLFTGAASFSGVLNPLADAGFLQGLFSQYTPDPDAIWGDPDADRATWAQHDPTALAPRLEGTRLYVSSGDGRPGPLNRGGERDTTLEPTVLRESRAFTRRLKRADIPVRTDFYGPGNHDWPYFERELRRALPTLTA
jgi:diacylglycerol O-acyltransferase / trehalose O-mycolyltransferase